jgi:hypothetical protein
VCVFTLSLYVPILVFMYLIDYVAIGTVVTVLVSVGIAVIIGHRNERKQNKI